MLKTIVDIQGEGDYRGHLEIISVGLTVDSGLTKNQLRTNLDISNELSNVNTILDITSTTVGFELIDINNTVKAELLFGKTFAGSGGSIDTSKFLRKDLSSLQEVKGSVHFKSDIISSILRSPHYNNSTLLGSGFRLAEETTEGITNSSLVVDTLTVRKKALFNELVINQIKHQGGIALYTMAAIECTSVEQLSNNNYKCYFDSKPNSEGVATVKNEFVVGDLARCQRFSYGPNISNTKYYWRKVVEVGDNYIVLSVQSGEYDPASTDIPSEGDNIVQLGNISNNTRQAAIMLDITQNGGGNICWYNNITTFSLASKDSTFIGAEYNSEIQKYVNIIKNYGNLYIGDRDINPTNYIKYSKEHGLEISGSLTVTGGSLKTLLERMQTEIAKIDNLEYLKKALNEDTTISGGLILTSLIELGYTDASEVFNIMSGINGVAYTETQVNGVTTKTPDYTKIAAWYGGKMIDKDHLNGHSLQEAAKSVFRFDGSGYLAGGNISWDTSGNSTFKGAITATSLTLGTGVNVPADNVSGFDNKTKSYLEANSYTTEDDIDPLITTYISSTYPNGIASPTDISSAISALNYTNVSYSDSAADKDGIVTRTITITDKNGNVTTKTELLYPKSGFFITNVGTTSDDTYFIVESDGCLKGKNAVIYGTIYSTAGQVGGWQIQDNNLISNNGAGNIKIYGDGTIKNSTIIEGVNTTYWELNKDGSGSVASENIKWSKEGVLTIQGANFLAMTDKGEMTLDTKTLVEGVTSVLSMFELIDGNIHVKNNRGFYSDSFISAGGLSSTSGGGGTDLTTVWQSLAENNVSNQIDLSHLSSIQTYVAERYITNGKIGVANGIASLDAGGKVPSSQLPSYVDDVLEYSSKSAFPATGETGKIYVDTTTNLTYRWSGTAYVEISPSLALGETSSTAYAGDKGKANATAISTLQGYFTNGIAKESSKVSNTLTFTGYQSKSFNGSADVSVAIPSALSNLTDDATHRLVSDTEKTAWGNKYDKPNGGIPNTDLANSKITIGTTQISLGATAASLVGMTSVETSTSVKIGSATLSWDATNQCLKIDKGFYSDSFISAGGLSTTQGGGGVDLGAVWASISSVSDEYASYQVGSTHLSDFATTIAGTYLTKTEANSTYLKLTDNYVSTFGGKKGAITLRGGLTANGSVNLAMSNNELQASIVGLGSFAYISSLAFSSLTNKPTTISGYGITDNLVNTIGGQKGTITLRGSQTANGSVNLAMNGTQIQASIVGLKDGAYQSIATAAEITTMINNIFA